MDGIPVSSEDRHRYCVPIDSHTCEEIDSLTERAEKAEAQVQAVRDVHIGRSSYSLFMAMEMTSCSCGSITYPCDTLRALDGTDE